MCKAGRGSIGRLFGSVLLTTLLSRGLGNLTLYLPGVGRARHGYTDRKTGTEITFPRYAIRMCCCLRRIVGSGDENGITTISFPEPAFPFGQHVHQEHGLRPVPKQKVPKSWTYGSSTQTQNFEAMRSCKNGPSLQLRINRPFA